MSFWNRINEKAFGTFSERNLMRIVLFLLVILLLQLTAGFWKGLASVIWRIFRPFVIGFVIAYIMRDPIRFGEKHKISNKVSVPVLYLLLAGLFIWLGASLVPLLMSRMSGIINSMIEGMSWLYGVISQYTGGESTWAANIFNSSVDALMDMQSLIPGISSAIPEVLSTAFGTAIMILLSFVISIFISFEWEKIRYYTVLFSCRISKGFYETLFAVNDELSDYLRSLLILMAVRFVEYSLLFFLVGHPDWLILAAASAVSLCIPYIGPTGVNVIAILSALQLPIHRVVILIAMICLLSQLDEYVITPMVHSRNLNISPLWSLFSIFCAGTLFGFAGFVIAIPCYLVIRVIIRRRMEYEAMNEPHYEQKEDV